MNKDLNFLKKQIKEQEIKDFEADRDRVFDDLIKKRVTFSGYKEIYDLFKDDKNFIVDSVIAKQYGVERLLFNPATIYIFRIRYINV